MAASTNAVPSPEAAPSKYTPMLAVVLGFRLRRVEAVDHRPGIRCGTWIPAALGFPYGRCKTGHGRWPASAGARGRTDKEEDREGIADPAPAPPDSGSRRQRRLLSAAAAPSASGGGGGSGERVRDRVLTLTAPPLHPLYGLRPTWANWAARPAGQAELDQASRLGHSAPSKPGRKHKWA
ncbi:unnamed protein product, partial [Urochloa humidicola]